MTTLISYNKIRIDIDVVAYILQQFLNGLFVHTKPLIKQTIKQINFYMRDFCMISVARSDFFFSPHFTDSTFWLIDK
jgi:hypothetical protein